MGFLENLGCSRKKPFPVQVRIFSVLSTQYYATLVLSKIFINFLHKKKLQGERNISVAWVLRKRPEVEAGTELGFAS